MLGDHINIHLKQGVKIITCDPPTGTIEAETRNGEVISINSYHQTPVWRWPVPGEKWMVTEENGSWFLDGIYERQTPYEPKPGELQKVQPGDTVLSAASSTIWKNVEGQLEPLTEAQEVQLSVSNYVENAAAEGFLLAKDTLKGEVKHTFEIPVSTKARFILVIFSIQVAENFGEIVLEGKHIAITERSGSVGAFYRTTLTVVVPPGQKCNVIGSTPRSLGEEPGEVSISHLWESIS